MVHSSVKSRRGRPRTSRSSESRARKISITVDERVLRQVESAARRAGRTLSAQVTEALARDLRHTRLRDLVEKYEASQGVISDEEIAAVRR